MNYLSNRNIYLCGDNDQAGKQGEGKLIKKITSRRGEGEIFFIAKPTAKDPADAASGGLL